ncbi:MAG: AIPR family protein, partial [Candidatus Margulisbacteria bacterium]|nr:AIPR family protein [Candidatus Margulisiibacteriota bacterium]
MKPYGPAGVSDLRNVKNFLLHSDISAIKNIHVLKLKHEFDQVILTKKLEENSEQNPLSINLYLVILGEKLTHQANEELKQLQKELKAINNYSNVSIQFKVELYTIDHLINCRWWEENREWRDRHGRKKDFIILTPKGQDLNANITDSKSSLFYCKCIDLVKAFGALGYQIFEPNVRCRIKKSPVNLAIKNSIKYRNSRQEFHFLNNGVTIICNNFIKPSKNRKSFKVYEPGVINGLQTVVTMHESYKELEENEKEHFEKNCFVLVRLLNNTAVKEINIVVKSTNNQNPMQARNLVSNDPVHILYERLFAEDLGWFYERKQGAWEAFRLDPKRWRTLAGKRQNDFKKGNARRRIDNEQAAQAWLSFIGFSSEAVHKKKLLFDESKELYELVFLRRTVKHGSDYKYIPKEALEKNDKNSPSHKMILAAYLCMVFAKKAAFSTKENRENTIQRKGLDTSNLSKEEISAKLSEDEVYNLNRILNGMSCVFTEFVGLILFRAFGKKMHNVGDKLLKNGSLAKLSTDLCFDKIKQQAREDKCNKDDLLLVIWFIFKFILGNLLRFQWRQR